MNKGEASATKNTPQQSTRKSVANLNASARGLKLDLGKSDDVASNATGMTSVGARSQRTIKSNATHHKSKRKDLCFIYNGD